MLIFVLVLFAATTNAEWVEIKQVIQPTGKTEESGQLPEQPSSGTCFGQGREACAPDIHSWTAHTWGTHNSTDNLSAHTTDVFRGAPRSHEGKMIVLRSLRDRVLNSIEQRIYELGGREGRTHKGMGSMEGALITISLLTFAVYLIKIVMMLIDSIHTKKATMMQVGSTSNPALPTFIVAPGR